MLKQGSPIQTMLERRSPLDWKPCVNHGKTMGSPIKAMLKQGLHCYGKTMLTRPPTFAERQRK